MNLRIAGLQQPYLRGLVQNIVAAKMLMTET